MAIIVLLSFHTIDHHNESQSNRNAGLNSTMNDSDSHRPEDETPIIAKVVGQDAPIHQADSPHQNALADDVNLPQGETSSVSTPGSPFADPGRVVRSGSPFAVEPANPDDPDGLWQDLPVEEEALTPEAFYDVGPLKYTAFGSVAASIMVLCFAIPACWWFPAGGTLIAGLGCALAIFGLYSPRKTIAGVCLMVHLTLFLVCYSQFMV